MRNYYQRNLPHYQPPEGEFFVTFRLTNSLPKSVFLALAQEYKQLPKRANADELSEYQNVQKKKHFAQFDSILDQSKHGENWLQNDQIAKIIVDKLHDFDTRRYLLICYCIMPNHVHLLFKLNKRDKSRSTKKRFPVTDILKFIKGSTAYQANKILNRTGSFWQHESYDHLVRNDEERERIIRYILLNPVKAGLVNTWKDWKWTYCNKKYLPLR